MTDTPRIQGAPDPRKSTDTGKTDVDPEKFKKVMKVEKSDETAQRDRRRQTKQQEDETETEEAGSSPTPSGDFKGMLAEGKPSDALSPEEGTKASFTLSESPPDEETAPFSVFSGPTPKKPKTEGEETKTPDIHIQGETKGEPTLSKEKKEKKGKEEDKKISPALVKEAGEEKKVKGSPPPLKKEESQKAEEVSETITTHEPMKEKEQGPAKKIEQTESELIKERLKSSTKVDTGLQEEHKKEDKEKEKKQELAPTETPLQTTPLVAPPTGLQAEIAPSYTQLSPQVFELFERMVGLMMFESYKGITTTTVTLSMPGSPFDKCQIKLEHYSTAPGAFNVHLIGNPKAVDLFSVNLSALASSFKEANLPFQVNLMKPSLLSSYSEEERHLIKRKGKSSDQGKEGDKGHE